MASAPVKVSIQGPDGSCTEIHVEPGSTVSQILDHEALRLPACYCGGLVTESAELLEPDSKVWETQVRLCQKCYRGLNDYQYYGSIFLVSV